MSPHLSPKKLFFSDQNKPIPNLKFSKSIFPFYSTFWTNINRFRRENDFFKFFAIFAISRPKIIMGKNFRPDILLHNTFQKILNRFQNFFRKSLIFGHFWAKVSIFWLGENFDIFTHFKRIVLWSFYAITCIPTSIELCKLTRFNVFLTKNGQKVVFRKFRVKIFFSTHF